MAKNRTISTIKNVETFDLIYDRFTNLALNMFEWKGIPENMKNLYFERPLYENGQALFIQDPILGFMVLNCIPDGKVNVYNEPVKYRAVGFNYNKPYTEENAVRIKNKPTGRNTRDIILMYADKLMEIERTMDVNVKAAKTPFIITCDEKDLLTFKNIYKQIDGNIPAIFADRNLNISSISVLETKAELITDMLSDYRHDVTNELLSILGINNANTDKKERLITNEVEANNQYIEENISLMLEERKAAAEKINKMFGLSLTVDLKINPKEMQEAQEMEEEPDDNAEVY